MCSMLLNELTIFDIAELYCNLPGIEGTIIVTIGYDTRDERDRYSVKGSLVMNDTVVSGHPPLSHRRQISR